MTGSSAVVPVRTCCQRNTDNIQKLTNKLNSVQKTLDTGYNDEFAQLDDQLDDLSRRLDELEIREI